MGDKLVIDKDRLTAIANAIRAKFPAGDSQGRDVDLMNLGTMIRRIGEIETGGGGDITYGDMAYRNDITGDLVLETYHDAAGDNLMPLYNIQAHAFRESQITSVSAPRVTTVSVYAFYSCSRLTSVSFPKLEYAEYAENAFAACEALTTVYMPVLKTTGPSMFAGAEALASISLPCVTTIETKTFFRCTSLSTIDIPLCTTIKNQGFSGCTAMTSIWLPCVTTTAASAFSAMTNLAAVKFGAQTPLSINAKTFNSCSALTDIYVAWSEGDIAGAPWGATNATIHYNTVFDTDGNVVS